MKFLNLDEISDFGRMKNDILDSVFVQSLVMMLYWSYDISVIKQQTSTHVW